jgi:MFS family permease
MTARDTTDSAKITQTLKDSIRDGQAWGIMNGFGTSYLAAFGVFLGATPFQLGALASVPQLLASMSQLLVVRAVRAVGSRKELIVLSALVQGSTWLAAAAMAMFGAPVWLFIGVACVFFVFGLLPAPAWSSLMGDLVPEDYRGKYFGRRNRAVGLVSFIAMAAGGLVLELLAPERSGLGFALIFVVAFFGRLISVYFLSRHYDPNLDISSPEGEGLVEFLRTGFRNDFGRLALYNAVFHVAIFVMAPLFVVYFLEVLEFRYWEFTVMLSAAAISNFLTMRYWGENADRFGNRVILTASSWVLVAVPLVWYGIWFVPRTLWLPLGLVIHVISGFAWAGFNLSASNYQFDAVSRERRVRLFGHYHLLHGGAMFAGGMIGGLLAEQIDVGIRELSGIFFVLLLSAALRFLVCLLLLPKILERRRVKRRPVYLYFYTVMPLEGLHADVAYGFTLTKESLRSAIRQVERRVDWHWLDRKRGKTDSESSGTG